MRWPWQPKRETRASAGGYTEALVAQLVAQAEGSTAAKATTTAAIEAAAGALSRAFAGAMVEGPEWAGEAVCAPFLSLVGRDLIRRGESLHAIRYRMGRPVLIPCSDWDWQSGGPDPATWTCRATAYGPSESVTWRLPARSVVYVCWGAEAIRPYRGIAPSGFASLSARQMAESERTLADEAGGPLAQLFPVPDDPQPDGDDDPLAPMKASLAKARGKAAFVRSMADAWGDGQAAAPRRDWVPSRLGPDPPAGVVELARDGFDRTLAACGTPPPLMDDRADGTAQREALRRWHLGTVLPLARMLETELSMKLEASIRLRFDNYPLDLQARATALHKLTDSGMARNEALAIVGLLMEGDE